MSDTAAYRIHVSVEPAYAEEESIPQEDRYVFHYTVTIRNDGDIPAQLVNRNWTITTADGEVLATRGVGVVGEQPLLAPGQQFRYTSRAMLPTPVGRMEGSYEMVASDGTEFTAPIPAFTLSIPRTLH